LLYLVRLSFFFHVFTTATYDPMAFPAILPTTVRNTVPRHDNRAPSIFPIMMGKIFPDVRDADITALLQLTQTLMTIVMAVGIIIGFATRLNLCCRSCVTFKVFSTFCTDRALAFV